MLVVFTDGSPPLSRSALARGARRARSRRRRRAVQRSFVLDLRADWLVLDGRSAWDGAVALALQASAKSHVAVMTEAGLRCARTWQLFPSRSADCVLALEERAMRGHLHAHTVDDEDDAGECAVELIDEDAVVADTRDGIEALRLDVTMPTLDGAGLLRTLRSQSDDTASSPRANPGVRRG